MPFVRSGAINGHALAGAQQHHDVAGASEAEPRIDTSDRSVTLLLSAGEAVRAVVSSNEMPWSAEYAALSGRVSAPTPDYRPLLELFEQIRAAIGRDSVLANELERLCAALGDGTPLRLLFHRLFPGQKPHRLLDSHGKPILSRREVEILENASQGVTREEIAGRLGIAPRTVDKHFTNIFKKLGVQRAMQAVGRAVTLGYLDIDAVDQVRSLSGHDIGDFLALDAMLSKAASIVDSPDRETLTPLALFGVFLLTLCGTTVRGAGAGEAVTPLRRASLIRISARGEAARLIPADITGAPGAVISVPAHGARQGFTPGNLLIAQYGLTQQRLNTAAIVELAADGRQARTFSGASDLSARLSGPASLAFALDGTLLVTSHGLTDAILGFRNGGATVARFADGDFRQICVHRSGLIFCAQKLGATSSIAKLDPAGKLIETFGESQPDVRYDGIAVANSQHVFVSYVAQGIGTIDEFDAQGRPVRSFPVPGLTNAHLAIDDQDRLYVPCSRHGDVKVVGRAGTIMGRYTVNGLLESLSSVVPGDGVLWVLGGLPQSVERAATERGSEGAPRPRIRNADSRTKAVSL